MISTWNVTCPECGTQDFFKCERYAVLTNLVTDSKDITVMQTPVACCINGHKQSLEALRRQYEQSLRGNG